MIVREFRQDDTYYLHRIASLSLDEEYSPEIFPYFHGQWPSGQVVACGYDDVPLGFISAIRTEGSSARIMMFAVDPDHRSRGIGSGIMAAFRQKAAMQGMRSMTLEVRVQNNDAISFYRKRGFVPCGVLRGLYRDGGDALKMTAPVQLNI